MQKDVANLWGNCSEHHLGVVDLFRIKENIAFDVYGWMGKSSISGAERFPVAKR
jgi:hypothetical protein